MNFVISTFSKIEFLHKLMRKELLVHREVKKECKTKF
jgi:hypothetical protein